MAWLLLNAFIQIYSENSEPREKTDRGSVQFGEEGDTDTLKAVDKQVQTEHLLLLKTCH